MLVGEIGIPRREFLYEMTHVEILLTVRGYFARQHSSWEQARLIAYCAKFCMGSKTTLPTLREWLPFRWEQRKTYSNGTTMSDEEVQRLRDLIRKENEK